MQDSADFDGAWYHLIETVYGAWLYSDERGFRTRHHREHVQGDYKNRPPAGSYHRERQRSRSNLKQQPVVLSPRWRPIVGGAFRDRLQGLGGFVLCLAQSGQHLHALVKLPREADPRIWAGFAKLHATFEAKTQGWTGKMWAKRGKEIRVRNRGHQVNVYRYILDHEKEGAWVWVWKKPRAPG
jgi:hypothetical protein